MTKQVVGIILLSINACICLEAESIKAIVKGLYGIARPLKSLPAKTIEIGSSERAITDVVVEIETLLVSSISMSKPRRIGRHPTAHRDCIHPVFEIIQIRLRIPLFAVNFWLIESLPLPQGPFRPKVFAATSSPNGK